MNKHEIKPEKYYQLSEMIRHNMLPWISGDVRTYKSFVDREAKNKNLLSPLVVGSGTGKRYYFEGKNIIALHTAISNNYNVI